MTLVRSKQSKIIAGQKLKIMFTPHSFVISHTAKLLFHVLNRVGDALRIFGRDLQPHIPLLRDRHQVDNKNFGVTIFPGYR